MTYEYNVDEIHIMIGKNIAKIRKEKGMSQLDLSLALGHKSVSIVASAERFYNKKHFNIEHLFKIAFILQVDICDLLKPDIENESGALPVYQGIQSP